MSCVSGAIREHSINKEMTKRPPQPQDLFYNSKTSCYERQGNYFFLLLNILKVKKKIKARLGQPKDPRHRMRTQSGFTHHFAPTSYQCCLPAAFLAVPSRLHKSEQIRAGGKEEISVLLSPMEQLCV